MVTENGAGTEPTAEQVAEQVTPPVTPPKETKPTPEVGKEEPKKPGRPPAPKPPTQEQIDDLVRKGKAEVQRAKDIEAQQLRDKIAQLEAESSKQWGEKFLKDVEEAGGDVDMAKRLVAMEADLKTRESKWQTERTQYDQYLTAATEREKVYAATELVFQYELGEEGQKELMKAQSPAEMESKAVKLAYEKLKAEREGKTPTDQIDSSLTSAPGEDWKNLTPDQILERGFKQIKK